MSSLKSSCVVVVECLCVGVELVELAELVEVEVVVVGSSSSRVESAVEDGEGDGARS